MAGAMMGVLHTQYITEVPQERQIPLLIAQAKHFGVILDPSLFLIWHIGGTQ